LKERVRKALSFSFTLKERGKINGRGTMMDKIKYRIILDAHKGGVQKVIRGFFTGDVASRTIAVNINASGLPCNLGEGTAAIMYVTKSNGVTNYGACEVIDNTVYYDVNQSDIDSPGIVEMQLKILNGESVLYAPLFALDVQESKVSDTEAETTPTFSALEAALAKAQLVYDTRIVSIEITPEYVFVVKYADDSEYTNDCLSDVFARADEAIQGVNDALSDFEESRTELQGYVDFALESRNVAESMAQSASGSADASQSFAEDASEFATRAEQAAERAETVADLTIDTDLSEDSTNPIANKAVAEAFENVDAKTLDGHEAEYFATADELNAAQTTSNNSLMSDGWYRVAELIGKSESQINGALASSPMLFIRRNHQNNPNEQHLLLFEVLSGGVHTITSLSSKSRTHLIKKARYTYNTTELKAYLEIYYEGGHASGNFTLFEITHGKTNAGLWQAITPTLTEETVEGVTVTTTYNIPANATPLTTGNMASHVLPLTGGYITGAEAGIGDRNSESGFTWGLKNAKRFITEQILSDGTYRIRDTNNDKEIIKSLPDGTTTFEGTASGITGSKLSKALTVEDEKGTILELVATGGNNVYTRYVGMSGALGFLGFVGADNPVLVGSDGVTVRKLHHDGNSAKTVVLDTDPGEGATVNYSDGTVVFTK